MSNKKKIILFNGPPGCGKDTAANFVHDRLGTGVYRYKMALPLKEACHTLLGLHGTLEELEPLKELAVKFKTNTEKQMTLRQWYIYLSEKVMKPIYGDEVFGRLAVENLRQAEQPVATVSDTGFGPEADPIINYFGPENVALIRVHRPGKSFAGDSRNYVELEVGTVIDLQNDSDLEEFEKRLWASIDPFLNR